jgi:Putative adhesin
LSTGGQTRGSILGGVLLILLGVLFLFARWNPDLRIWHVFWHYWPVLIILWGFAKLFDHLSAQQEGRTRPPIVTGSEAALMVLVILVIAGMGLYSRIRERNPDLDINLNMFHEQASQNIDVPVKTIPAGSHVTLTTDRGNITCHAGDSDDLRVNANLTASEGNESAAQDRLKTVKVVIEQGRDGYTVHPVNQEDGGSVMVDLDVTVPKNVSITANSNHGDISISGISGKASATTLHGGVEIHNTGSDASAEMTKGDVRINDVAGSVRVTGRGDEVDISDIAGDATIEGEFFGPVIVRNVTKTTRYVSQKADLALEHMSGRLELDSGQIEISDVGGSAKLKTSNKDLDIENVAGRLEISDVHGEIKVGYSQPPREEISITNESGGVDLTLPAKSNFQIFASSRGGDVQSDFDGSTDSQGDTPRFNAKIGTGVPKIQITTTYGTIILHKSS